MTVCEMHFLKPFIIKFSLAFMKQNSKQKQLKIVQKQLLTFEKTRKSIVKSPYLFYNKNCWGNEFREVGGISMPQRNKNNHYNEEQKRSEMFLVTVADGEVIRLEDVPDPVFSEKMVGEGFAVIPTANQVVAPISGKLYRVSESLHAYVIETQEGLEVLVHVGINTITLHGKGFETELKTGMSVTKGQPLVTFDREYLEEKKIAIVIPVVVIKGLEGLREADVVYTNNGIAGETVAMRILEND